MSLGVYPSQVPCSFCHKSVTDSDALWSEGLPYHDQCWKFYLANEIKKLEYKKKLGSITFAEASVYAELQIDYDIARKSPTIVPVSKLIDSDKTRFIGNSPLAIASIENLRLKASKERLQLKASNQRLLSTGKIDENLGAKNDPKNQRFLLTEDMKAEPL